MDSYQITFETWNKVAFLYQNKFMDLNLFHDTYDIFCELIEKSHPTIFEIGCGPGNITRYISSKRPDFQIEAIDVAPNMIALAKSNNPAVSFTVMDCRQIDTLTTKYCGIISGFCIPYLCKEDCRKFLKDCSELLHEDGIFYFSTIKGNYSNSGYVTGCTGDKYYIYFYDEDFLQSELHQNNFELIELKYKDFTKADGTVSNEMVFITRKHDKRTTFRFGQ